MQRIQSLPVADFEVVSEISDRYYFAQALCRTYTCIEMKRIAMNLMTAFCLVATVLHVVSGQIPGKFAMPCLRFHTRNLIGLPLRPFISVIYWYTQPSLFARNCSKSGPRLQNVNRAC